MAAEARMPQGIPAAYLSGGQMRGRYHDGWYTEEEIDTVRLAIKVRARLHQEESPYQRISIYDSEFFGRFLTLDDIMMFTQRDEYVYHEMLVHVPLCNLAAAESVLIIGGGDCGCLREVLRHSGIRRVVQCELDRRVTEVCKEWFSWVTPALADSRVETVYGDGRAYVRERKAAWDLIIVDSTDPVGPATALFLADFYRDAAAALRPHGVLTAQVGSPHWEPDLVGAVFGQQRQAFPSVQGYLGQLPTYQSGTWCWSYASRDSHDPSLPRPQPAAEMAASCRYYNAAAHTAAFSLPNYARRAVVDGRGPA
ncbi:MAG: polyamine aminopropyltransferase [Acidobacteria bacterium]|nr:polyamine aminopropyltransferase [Acidobacteriota bacterium]